MHRELTPRAARAEGEAPPSIPTLHRAIRRDLTPGERTGLAGGEREACKHDEFLARTRGWPEPGVGDRPHADPGAGRCDGKPPRPSITWFTDCATNAITGVAVTPGHPSRKSVLAALRSADLRDGPHRRCGARFVMVRSNWQLNAAKFEAIGAFEQRLPAYAHSKAEWAALGEGRDLPPTHVEQWVPVNFHCRPRRRVLRSGGLTFDRRTVEL